MKPVDKPLRLVDYLIALTKTNTKIVRNLDEYRSILWLYEIPHEPKHCFTLAWGEEDEHGDDSWVEVKKFKEPPLPKIPEQLYPWVKHETLYKRDDLPEIHDNIVVENEEPDQETGELFKNVTRLDLKDFPEIQNLWDTYLDKQWLPWNEFYARYLSVQNVYAQLFHIYQEQQKLGEEYELVCCIGLLTWRTPTGHISYRHIISAKASLEFEPHLGKFTVRPTTDSDSILIELDMLDIEDQPQNTRQLIEEGRESLQDNFWDRASIDPFLNAVANSLADSGQGQYQVNHLAPSNAPASDKPLIEFAPALILRKRSARYLEELLLDIKKQIEAGVSIPQEFLDLCEGLDTEEGTEQNKDGDQGEKAGHYTPQPEEIYFPLLANEEQRLIIRTLDRQRGVLVQGPPGTGKSHTIANLICHLLATGKRVLVTAKTPRALQVLHDKLPDEIKPLCINLLGSGSEERESLEKSVSSILSKTDQKDLFNSEQFISNLETQIRIDRKAKSETDAKLIALRESETFIHSIDGNFKGTAANIARQIKEKNTSFDWFKDEIPSTLQLPLSQTEIDNLCDGLLEFDLASEQQLNLFILDPVSGLPNIDELRNLFEEERNSEEKHSGKTEDLETPEGRALLFRNPKDIELLVNSLGVFTSSIESVLSRNFVWIHQAVHEVLTDRDASWKELLRLSKSYFKKFENLSFEIDALNVFIPVGMDLKKLLNDAKALLSYFEAGGGKGFWIFKSKILREHGYFIDRVTVDGLHCNNRESLKKLIEFLNFGQILDYIWSLWSGKATRYDGPVPLQLAEIKELNDSLQCVVELSDLRTKVLEQVSKINGLSIPLWDDITALHKVIEICFTILNYFYLLSVRRKLGAIHSTLTSFANRIDAHPINKEILTSFIERNITRYSQLVESACDLRKKAEKIKRKQNIIQILGKAAPVLSNDLINCTEAQKWVSRLKTLPHAWAWARAKSWLSDFLNSDAESLERHSYQLDEEIRKNLAQLASIKAWDFCFSRMQEDDRRHLMAWQQAMKRYGKGTGRHAHTHRRNAQLHLRECRDAVPSWIMPLHRVYETVPRGNSAGIFDVIIIDEASQCGPEALPLLYLGMRVLVVGDDKQISPEAVGINRDQVQRLMRDYLSDFKYADSFDVENSLFAHGKIRFRNRITLCEHFRCMPEIINFSNDLCYRSDPLIPLRQYPPERLEPLKTIFLSSGYREGSGQRVINRPEAEALVNKVEECCKDERYQGMTMGVIVLQGEAQAYLIEEMLLKCIGAEEMEKRRLICGNPYSFQGDERDVIFLSLVAAPNERIGTLTQEADRRRFNVAASRAKDQMWLFHSVTSNHLSAQCFRRRLLEYFYNPKSQISQALGGDAEELREKAFQANRMIEKPPHPFDSWFEVDVALDVGGRGFRVIPQFKFADKWIDLVIQGTKSQLAVECDGDIWHGAEEHLADTERQRKLERCGWQFFRIRGSSYYAAPEKSLEPLWIKLNRMGIRSLTEDFSFESNGQKEENGKENTVDPEESETFEASVEEEDFEADNIHDEDEADPGPSRSTFSRREGPPETIHEAFRVKTDILGRSIIDVLRDRPNQSCMRENMPTYILKKWNIKTRGLPREQFSKKVDDLIAVMARKGYIMIYKSKNVRIKLGWVDYPGSE